jgi:hypothetical protein
LPTDKTSRVMMAYCDAEGRIYDHPELEMLGWDGECWRPVSLDEVIPLPEGSDLFTLPGRRPAGLDATTEEVVVWDEPGVFAASVFLAPAYLRLLLPAYETLTDAPGLPLYAYSAVGILDGELVAAAIRVDPDVRQDPFRFDIEEVAAGVAERRKAEPSNRVLQHLTRCALEYHCRAAQNFFLGRFEAPLPAAPTCNAYCVGCISLQDPNAGDELAPASHDRIAFEPSHEELASVAVGHIERVGEDAVVSFGQGCEGEPLSEGDALIRTVEAIRLQTAEGVINLNSNASKPDVVEALCVAGLNSLRISTNSARSDVYAAYYRPKGYTLEDVQESGRVVKRHGGYVMLNYFIFPGVTDTREELEALSAWLSRDSIDMVQLRNLNIDPELYLDLLTPVGGTGEAIGIVPWLAEISRRHPNLRFGYFNPASRLFDAEPHLLNLEMATEEFVHADL